MTVIRGDLLTSGLGEGPGPGSMVTTQGKRLAKTKTNVDKLYLLFVKHSLCVDQVSKSVKCKLELYPYAM